MDILYQILVFLHLLGMAGIISGWLIQVAGNGAKAPKALLHSSLLQLVTGLALVGVAEMGDGDVAHIKIGVKLVVLLVILALGITNLRRSSAALASTAGGLTVLNVAIAVFWN